MPKRNFSGQNFGVSLADKMLNVVSANIAITNNGTVGMTNGVPNGWIDGSQTASGQIVVNTVDGEVIKELARTYGSYQKIPLFDMMFFAGDAEYNEKIEVFGVKIILEETYNGESAGGTPITKTFRIEVCSPDFIKIDGVPVLDPELTGNIQHVN